MIRKEIFTQVGYYSEGESGFPEDYDLWIKATDITKIANIPEILVEYWNTNTNNSSKYRKEYQHFTSRIRQNVIQKYLHSNFSIDLIDAIERIGKSMNSEEVIQINKLIMAIYTKFVS